MKNEWIDITEKRPEKPGRYLFFYSYRYKGIPGNITKSFHKEIFIGRIEIKYNPMTLTKRYKWFTGGRLVSRITHYMELPEYPEESKEKNEDNITKTQERKIPKLIPAAKWNKYHLWPPKGGLVHLLHNRKTNGFDKVIKKVGKRILIDEEAFFKWCDEKNKEQNNE